jgi:hypothetical protein
MANPGKNPIFLGDYGILVLDSRLVTASFSALFPSEGGETGDAPCGAQTTLNHILPAHWGDFFRFR